MRFGVRSKAVADLEDVKANLITVRRIIFTPSVEVKDELKNTAIQITCLDEDGNVLKRVTSGDTGEVEDTENSGSSEGSGTGSETSSVEAPVISGETPFDETTQVTISGPDGAEIRYTTDGTAPNAESSLYSEAITLTDTATVKAIAIKDGESSEAATKVFTKNGSDVGSGGFETGA